MNNFLIHINRRDARFAVLWTSMVMMISAIPYAYMYYATPPGMKFIGWLAAPSDHNVYLAWMRQAMDGILFMEDKFTTEPHHRAFVLPLWLLLGKISSITGLGLILVYDIARILLGASLFLAVYVFVSQFCRAKALRNAAFILVTVSGGFGWILALISQFTGKPIAFSSVDLIATEALTFRAIHYHAHFALSLLLMLGVFMVTFHSVRSGRMRYAVVAGMLGFLLAFEHPYDIITVWLTLALFLGFLVLKHKVIPWAWVKSFAITASISVVPFLYNLYYILTDPVFAGWSKGSIIPSPAPGNFVLGYGLVFLFALVGMCVCARRRRAEDVFLLSWVLSVAILLYSPFRFQLRFVHGLHITLCILAAIGLSYLWRVLRSWRMARDSRPYRRWVRRTVFSLVILATLPTNVATLANDMFFHRHADPFPAHLPKEIVDAFGWLRENTQPREIVVSSYLMGNFIPGWSGNTVFIGHWLATLDRRRKEQQVGELFSELTPDLVRKEFLRSERIRYLYHGPYERELGGFVPDDKDYLVPVYRNSLVTIFEVKIGGG
jgi:hypothetical protein